MDRRATRERARVRSSADSFFIAMVRHALAAIAINRWLSSIVAPRRLMAVNTAFAVSAVHTAAMTAMGKFWNRAHSSHP